MSNSDKGLQLTNNSINQLVQKKFKSISLTSGLVLLVRACVRACVCMCVRVCVCVCVCMGGWYSWGGVMGSEALPSPADINHTLDSPAGHRGPWFIVRRKPGQPWWSFNKTSKKALTHPLPTSPCGTDGSGVPAIPHTAISHWGTMGKARKSVYCWITAHWKRYYY